MIYAFGDVCANNVELVNPDQVAFDARTIFHSVAPNTQNPFAHPGSNGASVLAPAMRILIEVLCKHVNEALVRMVDPTRILEQVDVQIIERAGLHLMELAGEKEKRDR